MDLREPLYSKGTGGEIEKVGREQRERKKDRKGERKEI